MQKESTKENKPTGIKTFINVWRPFRDWLRQRPSPTPTVTSTSATVVVDDTDDEASFYRQQKPPKKHPQPPLPQPPPPNSTVNGLVDQQFSRTARARMSLPIMQHQNNKLRQQQVYSQLHFRGQQRLQSLGHIYLQHMGETKQANLPNELTALDTIRALFVCAFPNMLTMQFMSQPHVKIYIYNPSCNIFYELRDIGDVRHETVLRIHQSDPILALQQQSTISRSTTPFQHQINNNSQTLPPPKPRRMIPVNGLPPSPPDLIYGNAMNAAQLQQVHARPLHQLNQQQQQQHHHIAQQRKFQSYTPTPVQYQQQHYQTINQQRSPHHHQQMQINNNRQQQQPIYSTANLHQIQHQQMLPQLSHQ